MGEYKSFNRRIKDLKRVESLNKSKSLKQNKNKLQKKVYIILYSNKSSSKVIIIM